MTGKYLIPAAWLNGYGLSGWFYTGHIDGLSGMALIFAVILIVIAERVEQSAGTESSRNV